MGYMPVITNLAAPLLDFATKDGKGPRFEAIKFASFAEMGEALRNDDIQAAFMIAPLAVVLRQQGEDVKIVMIGNRHESTMVTRKNANIETFSDLRNKTVAVPMRYSGHHLSLLRLMEKHHMPEEVNIVEMNPPDMAAALSAGSLDAYYVGEPFAAQTAMYGESEVLFYVEDVWKHFICNLVLVKNKYMINHPEMVEKLVHGAARSGIWAGKHPEKAARIASKYWNQPEKLIRYALQTPPQRIVFDRFVPAEAEIREMAQAMVRFGLIESADISGLVHDRIAKNVNTKNITDFSSILKQTRP
jgi:NitT/TauT family transport system substrate-binding protein